MNIFVIGCGRWGSLITWYLDHIGHRVTLYGRQSSPRMQSFLATRQNDLLTLPESVGLTTELREAEKAEVVIISIGSQSLRALLREEPMQSLRGKTVVLCMKGLEMGTGERLSVIAGSLLHESNTVAVWLGPGHVQEFYRGIPNCMVIDSENDWVKRELVQSFSSDLIRFYYGGCRRQERGGHRRRAAGRRGDVQPEGGVDEPGHTGGSAAHTRHGRQRAVRLRAVPSGGL